MATTTASQRPRGAPLPTSTSPQLRSRGARQDPPTSGADLEINTSGGNHGADGRAGLLRRLRPTRVKVCVIIGRRRLILYTSLKASGDLPPSTSSPARPGGSGRGIRDARIVHDLLPAHPRPSPRPGPRPEAGAGLHRRDERLQHHRRRDLSRRVAVDGLSRDRSTVTTGVLALLGEGNEERRRPPAPGRDFTLLHRRRSAPLAGANLHTDFGDGGNSILVTFSGPPIDPGPRTTTTPTAASSTSTYDMDGGLTTIFDASTNTQDGTATSRSKKAHLTGERLIVGSPPARPRARLTSLIVFRGARATPHLGDQRRDARPQRHRQRLQPRGHRGLLADHLPFPSLPNASELHLLSSRPALRASRGPPSRLRPPTASRVAAPGFNPSTAPRPPRRNARRPPQVGVPAASPRPR